MKQYCREQRYRSNLVGISVVGSSVVGSSVVGISVVGSSVVGSSVLQCKVLAPRPAPVNLGDSVREDLLFGHLCYVSTVCNFETSSSSLSSSLINQGLGDNFWGIWKKSCNAIN